MNIFSEKDWKLFRSKIADWQEAYEKLEEIKQVLQNDVLFDMSSLF